MKCTECGSTMTKAIVDHVYRESGLDNVTLRSVTEYTCPEDGRTFVQIPSMAQLHKLIAQAIAEKPARLLPAEVRFVRDHLELTNGEFADLMGVSPTQSSRWTTTEPISMQAERFLRVAATLGPDFVKPAGQEHMRITHESLSARSGDAVKTLEDMVRMIQRLPPSSAEAKQVKIGMRRAGSNWKSEAATNN